MTSYVVHRDGRAATAEELGPLAFAGYAHFTAAQVRGGRIRGLDLHLERLRAASAELFGRTVPQERIREYLRAALAAGPGDLSLTVTVYSRAGEFTAADDELEVLVRTGPAASGPRGPLALAAVPYERPLPEIKHAGEVAKTYLLRKAVADGYDDAAFTDQRGRLSEATIWNLAFWDGTAVVWPMAGMLDGTTMGIVRRQLARLGVPQRDEEITLDRLPDLAGAVVMNSWTPGVPVRRIGALGVPEAPSFVELLHRAYEAEPLTAP
ncbi:aminotransferase class IV family protein [Streptomyces yaizuensis]|uniref:Aminotransferase class IV family protein n=1 Tax=Streptomyces yaizuensis TaxID=2989713 RepID=A0ABQ5NZ01_9ACTN|nr:aminotransferase class IV family protein [Streptomyces sp. YSPA8]GLF95452.1 aminotransferase class IV family protein [Streptomyces sp. YSPA8]